MEFLGMNKAQTTTMISVNSSTDSAQYLIDRNTRIGYVSSGYNGTTATVVSISFTAATVLSHVVIQRHNLKEFTVYYDGTTTNSLFSTSTNSDTNSYIEFSSIPVASIHVRAVEAMVSGEEKSIGELIVTERKLLFERNPNIASFSPTTYRKQIVHNMPDGGTTVFNFREKFRAKLSWKHITSDFNDAVYALHRAGNPLYYVQKPTSTAWDGAAYEVLLTGGYDFKESSNDLRAGYSGSLMLQQTENG